MSSSQNLEILHASKSTLSALGFRQLSSELQFVSSISEASLSDKLESEISAKAPDLLVIEIDRHHNTSPVNLVEIRSTFPKLKILAIFNDTSPESILSVTEAGVHGYLMRECSTDEMKESLKALSRGEKFYCNRVVNLIMDNKLSAEERDCSPMSLTSRETEIITLIAKGLTNKKIATQLNLSPHTIHSHRKNIMRKLNVNSASGITLYAVNAGLVASESSEK